MYDTRKLTDFAKDETIPGESLGALKLWLDELGVSANVWMDVATHSIVPVFGDSLMNDRVPF